MKQLLLFFSLLACWQQGLFAEEQAKDGFEGWILEGHVHEASEWSREKLQEIGASQIDFRDTQGAWTGVGDRNGCVGKLISPEFTLGKDLMFFAGGNLQMDTVQLRIVATDSDDFLRLKCQRKTVGIELKRWTIPLDWRGRKVQLIAEDNDPVTGRWVGISNPFTSPPTSVRFANLSKMLWTLVNAVVPLAFFVLLGFSGWILFHNRRFMNPRFGWIVFLATPFVVAYPGFYLSVYNQLLGFAYSLLAGCIALAICTRYYLKHDGRIAISGWYVQSFLYCVAAVWLIASLAQLFWHHENWVILAQNRLMPQVLPLDNYLPFLTMDRLFHGEGLKPYIIHIQVSDRPPLLGATMLMFRAYGIDTIPYFQIHAMFIHSLLLFALAQLLRDVGLDRRRIYLLLGLVVFSGTFTINALFVWPKLLPVAFIVPVFMLLLIRTEHERNHEIATWSLVSLCSVLALLVHQGSIFVLIPIFLLHCVRERRLSLRGLIAGAAIGILLFLPWLIFKGQYAPPGNNLIKHHLAGYVKIDDVSFLEALKIGYGNLTFPEWMQHKWENLLAVLGNYELAFKHFPHQLRGRFEGYRNEAFLSLVISMGVVILGYLVSPWTWKHLARETRKCLTNLLIVLFASLVLWILLMFLGGRTVLFQGSYFVPVLALVGGGLLISGNRRLFWLLCILNFLFYIVVWGSPFVQSTLHDHVLMQAETPDWGVLPVYLLLLFGIQFAIPLIARER